MPCDGIAGGGARAAVEKCTVRTDEGKRRGKPSADEFPDGVDGEQMDSHLGRESHLLDTLR